MKPSRNSKLKQAFDALCNATDSEQVINLVLACCHYQNDSEGEPSTATLADIARHEPVQIAHNATTVDWNEIGDLTPRAFRDALGFEGNAYDVPELIEAYHQVSQEVENIDKRIRDFDENERALLEKCHDMGRLLVFFTFGALLIQDFAERIEAIHRAWKEVREYVPGISHPLVPIVRAWLQDQTAKRITTEYDRKHSVGIIEREHMGSIRDVIERSAHSTSDEIREIKGVRAGAPDTSQIEIPGLEFPSVLPAVLPLQAVRIHDSMETTKRGAVAMPIRLFFEAIMALEPHEAQADIRIQLGDLLQYLNPDGKYHRTNHLPYVLQGLENLYWLRIPYRSDPDNPATEVDWIPVLPRTVPNEKSGNDASIILEVKLPPDVRSGMMVEKEILRQLGKHSSARFNAYLTACWLFDKYGTVKGKLIDPTKPIENRDADGHLTDKKGEKIVNSRGKPIVNLYHSDAIRNLAREQNPAREKYPILTFDDLIRACFPKGYPHGQRAKYLKRAKAAFDELDAKGTIQIERFRHGWRIMPSESHLSRHRGLRESY